MSILKGHNTQHSGHMGKKIHTELMFEIYFNSLVRTIVKDLRMKFS